MHSVQIPGTSEMMLNKDYWIDKLHNKNKLIMDSKEIDALNDKILQQIDSMFDLDGYQETISKEELLKFIGQYKVPDKPRYDIYGKAISNDFYQRISDNTNIDMVGDITNVKYGIAVQNIPVRSFPTEKGIYETDDDKEFDLFQETLCQALEPVLIFHESRDKEWYFIQKYNYRGWVKKIGIAVGEKEKVFSYVNSEDFLMVTGNHVITRPNPFEKRVSRQEFDMGTRIPLESRDSVCQVGNQSSFANYVVLLPVREDDGSLDFKDALISVNDDVTEGYLEYTRQNVITQVFKLLGDRYGWGDSFRGRDCSSTLMYVYKTFGIILPRNGDDQEKVPGRKIIFKQGASADERIKLLNNLKPGAGLYMSGHVMMYLGEDKGSHYMIHNFHKYGKLEGSELKTYCVNEVAVTDCLLLTSKGISFIDRFTSAIEFE